MPQAWFLSVILDLQISVLSNPMQVSSREISEAWHIRSKGEARPCIFGSGDHNLYPGVGLSGFNLTASYFTLSEMIGCRSFSPFLGRGLQISVNMVHVESAREHIAYS